MKVIYGACVALALAACQSTERQVAFDAKAAEFIKREGNAQIDGHAFYRSETGRVVFAAGEHVWLIPRTPYADDRFAQLYGNARYERAAVARVTQAWFMSDPDPDYVKYTRSTKAESNGRFTFERVAPGEYYVATSVTWRPVGETMLRGGAIYERVIVTGKEKEPIKVIVSGR